MKLLLTIDVLCAEGVSVKGADTEINMVPFTAKAHGEYFKGETVGTGVDTQRLDKKTGAFTLSARYMLEGTDCAGNACRIFIDNSSINGGLRPVIVTDSPVLAAWENMPLSATVEPCGGGRVTVKIFSKSR